MGIGWILLGILLITMLVGMVYGLKRGFAKAGIRILTVVAAALLTIFLTPTITTAICNIDLSGMNIMISGVQIKSISELTSALGGGTSAFAGVLAASPTLLKILNVLPIMILNIFLFIFIFLIFKALFWIIYIIISKLALPKREKGVAPPKRWWGALIGAVQGALCFAIILMPVFGLTNLIGDEMSYISSYRKNGTEITASSYLNENSEEQKDLDFVQNVSINSDNVLIYLNSDEEFPISNPEEFADLKNINVYLDEINNNFLIKTFNFFGYKKASAANFDNLTNIDLGGEVETNLRTEVHNIVKIFARIENVANVGLENMSDSEKVKINEAVDIAFDSPLFGNVAYEITSYMANAWSSGTGATFLGMPKPNLGPADSFFVELLKGLKSNSKDDLKSDFKVIVNFVSESTELVNAIINSEDTSEAMRIIGSEGTIESLIDCLVQGKAIRQALPQLVQTGIDYVAPTLNIPENDESVDKALLDKKATNFYNNIYEIASNQSSYTEEQNKEKINNQFILLGLEVNESDIELIYDNLYTFSSADDVKSFVQLNFNLKDWVKDGIIVPDVVTQKDLKINKTANDVNWETEKVVLGQMFSGFVKIYDMTETEGNLLSKINFDEIANVCNAIRDSQLFDGIDQNLIIAMLESESLSDLSVGDKLMLTLRDKTSYENLNFTSFFGTVKSSLLLAQQLNTIKTDPTAKIDIENVADMLEGLKDPTTAEIITDMASKENLVKAGADEKTAEVVEDLVDTLVKSSENNLLPTTEEEKQTATDAITSIVDVMENAKDDSKNLFDNTSDDEADKAEMENFVEKMLASNYVYNATIDKGVELGFKNADQTTNLTEKEKTWLIEILNEKISTGADLAKCSKIANMFGVDFV